ncbi:MAG: hypothetical protein WAP57_11815 [Aquabacterium commune]|uniref:hypothetical protein n=1 Tax=Aquabacterium commune TaxID=70586 RepID=UPI003BAF4D81
MSEAKPTNGLLHNAQVFALNAKHGWFEFGDAQSDVSRAFAADAIAEYERVRNEATAICVQTGLTPSQLVERVEELEGAAKLVLDWYEAENDHSKTDFYQRVQMCRDSEDAIRAALSKARPNTAEGEAIP